MQLAAHIDTVLTLLTGADINMPESASVAEQSRSELIMPSHAQASAGAMLRVEDELAGLIEAANTPADQAGAHTTKPEPASLVPGELSLAQSKSADASAVCRAAAQLSYCCAVLCSVLLCSAALSGGYELALRGSMVRSCLFCPALQVFLALDFRVHDELFSFEIPLVTI